MVLKGINFDRSLVTPDELAAVIDKITGGRSCVLQGMKFTPSSASLSIGLTAGMLVIQGYAIQATPAGGLESITISTAGIANTTKYLCATIDLNQTNIASGSVGTNTYKVDYKQVRFEFLDESVVRAQHADYNNMHDAFVLNPKRVVSLPLYKAVFTSSGTLPVMTRCDESYFDSLAGSQLNTTSGMAYRCGQYEHVLKKTANQDIPLTKTSQAGADVTTPLPFVWTRDSLVTQLPNSNYDNLLIQKDGIYRFDISGDIFRSFYTPPATPQWRVTGYGFEIQVFRTGGAQPTWGDPHTPPTGTWSAKSVFNGYTTGQDGMHFVGSTTMALYKGDQVAVRFATTAPTNANNTNKSAINPTTQTGNYATRLRHVEMSLELVQGFDYRNFMAGGAF